MSYEIRRGTWGKGRKKGKESMSGSEHEKKMECAGSPQNKVSRSRRRNHNSFWGSHHYKREIGSVN